MPCGAGRKEPSRIYLSLADVRRSSHAWVPEESFWEMGATERAAIDLRACIPASPVPCARDP